MTAFIAAHPYLFAFLLLAAGAVVCRVVFALVMTLVILKGILR